MNAATATTSTPTINFRVRFLDGFLGMTGSLGVLGFRGRIEHVAPVRPLLHLVLRGVGHDRRILVELPTTAERLVEGDEIRRDLRTRLGICRLLRKERTLRVEDTLV